MKRSSKSTASKFVRIAITTGDHDGVGWEVAAKALSAIGPKTGVQFLVYRQRSIPTAKPKIKKFKGIPVLSLEEGLRQPFDSRTVIEILSVEPAGRWVEETAQACMQGQIQALVTAPLSKTSIVQSGMKDIGHTEILQRVSGQSDLFMAFLGKKFNVILGTGHKPTAEAIQSLNLNLLSKIFSAAKSFVNVLPKQKQSLPVALVGVNPHAGEGGLIGSEEGWMQGLLDDARARGLRVVGPLVPDAAFLPKNWPLFSTYISLYHDQGLIPFKLVHGFSSGVHLTLGLPFVRTSVDHGTAKDLFGKNKADPGSMKDAILTALKLYKESYT